MLLRYPALIDSPNGLFTYRQAGDAGLAYDDLRRLVRSGDLVLVRRGVYVEAERWAALDPYRGRPILRIHAAALVLRCTQYVFSHDSAALLHGLGTPDARTAQVHVTRRKVHGDADRAGIKHHRAPFQDEQVCVVGGLPVLEPGRTALDMAREHGLVAGVACADAALRVGVPRDALVAERARMRCWPGSRTMDQAIALADPGSESWLESEGRVFVHALNIGWPHTQFGLSDGRRTVWCDLRVGRHIVEIDGLLKYDEDQQPGLRPREILEREKRRQDFISGFKLGMSRLTAHDLRAGRHAAVARIRREYEDTCRRFGTDVSDLAAYIVRRR